VRGQRTSGVEKTRGKEDVQEELSAPYFLKMGGNTPRGWWGYKKREKKRTG